MSIVMKNGTKFFMYLGEILNCLNLNHVSKNATDKIIDATPDLKIKDLDFESFIKKNEPQKYRWLILRNPDYHGAKLILEFFKDITDNYFSDFSITCFRFNINCSDNDLWVNFINDKWDGFPEFIKEYYDYDKQWLIEKTKRGDDDSIAVLFKRMYVFIINELVPEEVESEFNVHDYTIAEHKITSDIYMKSMMI